MTHPRKKNIACWFDDSAQRYGQNPALFVDEAFYTYAILHEQAARIGSAIQRLDPAPEDQIVALYAYRSFTAYSALLGILFAGKGYTPLNPLFPVTRNCHILNLSQARIIIIDRHCEEHALPVLRDCSNDILVFLPDHDELPQWTEDYDRHNFLVRQDLAKQDPLLERPAENKAEIAYLLFTSGSTGVPKGVIVLHENVNRFVASMIARYEPTPEDRFSQNSDLTFDASVYDMFVCWGAGACLYSIPQKIRMAPAKFIQEHELTFWESVPSIIGFMKRMYLIKPDCFPSLRWSIFGGEQLSVSAVQLWQEAAPNSRIDNSYGPTEGTIAITGYLWQPETSPAECHMGIVPIGLPYDQQEAAIFADDIRQESDGARGELCLSGEQVTPGYWQNEQETKKHYIALPDHQGGTVRWYKTGDLVIWKEKIGFVYLGRKDRQLKIRGYRAEILEIEYIVSKGAQSAHVAVLGWPETESGVNGVVAFVSGSTVANQEILQYCARNLPSYMVPTAVHRLAELPVNANGKTDLAQLKEMLSALSA